MKNKYPPTINFQINPNEEHPIYKDHHHNKRLAYAYLFLSIGLAVLLVISIVTNTQQCDIITNLDTNNEEWSISKLQGVYYVAGDKDMYEVPNLIQVINNL